MTSKDFTSNRKYFTQRNPLPFHVAYVVTCAVAIVLFFLSAWFWPLAFAIFFVGSVFEITVCQRHVSDKYFESFLSDEQKQFASEFEELYQPVDPRLYHRNAVGSAALSEKHGDPVYGGEYRFLPSDFECLGIPEQIRPGTDGVVRSSVYVLTGIQIDPRRVCLMTKRIGMTEERSHTETAAFPYAALSSVSLETVELPSLSRAAHCIEMVFHGLDGSECFRLPVHGDFVDEERAEHLNDLIRKSTET